MRGIHRIASTSKPTQMLAATPVDDPGSVDLGGVSTLVLVSAGYAEDDVVVLRHEAVVAAAARDGVRHVVHTSLTGAGEHLGFALAHRATEQIVRGSGIAWTILGNGLYAELFGGLLPWRDGALESAFGTGALAAVTRRDLAAAAAVVAAAPMANAGRTYELVGRPVIAQEAADVLGVQHRTISLGEYRAPACSVIRI